MIAIKREDYDFLVSSTKFCERIEGYTSLFELDSSLISTYRSDDLLLNQLLADNSYDGEVFEYYVAQKIKNMKVTYNYLAELCKVNENYTVRIGRHLGIEDEVNEEGLYLFSEN